MAEALLRNVDQQRTYWIIKLPVGKVLEAAREKAKWHGGRLYVWEETREKTKENLRTKGLVLDESVLQQEHSSYSNSGRAPSVAIDNSLVKDLEEANSKVKEHKDKLRAFESWIEFLEAAQGDLDLTLSDYLYFFGK